MRSLFFILSATFVFDLTAQIRNPLTTGSGGTSAAIIEDTTNYPELVHEYVLSDDMYHVIPFTDTVFDQRFQFVDPTRKNLEESIHLGYLGSSVLPLSYNTIVNRGWNLGYHQYDIYKTDIDSIRFYKSNRTTADLSFYQISGNQNNFNANADYHQNFKDDISLSVNYNRYNFEGSYRNQDNQSTSFIIGFLHEPKGKNYSTYFSFVNNTHNESFNGGYLDSTQLFGPFSSFRGNVSTALSDTRNRHSERSFIHSYTHDLAGKSLSLNNRFIYALNNYLYYDEGNLDSSDSSVYKSFITDSRGVRNQLANRTLTNEFTLNSSIGNSLNFKAGVAYDRIKIDDDYADTRHDVTLLFKGFFNWRKLQLNVKGHLGIAENAGNTLLDANTRLKIGKMGTLDLSWSSFVTEPSLVQRELVLNQQNVYSNDFTKIIGTTFKGGLVFEKLRTALYFQQDIINNSIYWDGLSNPVQYDDLFTSTKLKAKSSIKLWKFGLDNSAVYQVFSENIYHLPDWYTTHDLFFESHLFRRKLHLRLGSNLRIIPSGKMNQFNPVVGQFYQGYDNTLLYPEWNGYVIAKINRFRVLIQYDNIMYWITEDVNENIARHPMLDSNLKFGVRWLLLD